MKVFYNGILLIVGLQDPSCFVFGSEYIGFVVDDTGSMHDKISAVSSWVENTIAGKNDNYKPTDDTYWLAVSYNDPGIGGLSGPTKDTAQTISYIKNLKPKGGGDCPEMALSGIEKLISGIPGEHDGCKIYLLSDATPKDAYKALAIYTLLEQKGCVFVTILTGCCGTCPGICEATSPEYCDGRVFESKKRSVTEASFDNDGTIFYKLAEKTNGTFYLIDPVLSSDEMFEVSESIVPLTTAEWSPNSECSVTCGIGIKQRKCLLKGVELSSERCGSGSLTAECTEPTC